MVSLVAPVVAVPKRETGGSIGTGHSEKITESPRTSGRGVFFRVELGKYFLTSKGIMQDLGG